MFKLKEPLSNHRRPCVLTLRLASPLPLWISTDEVGRPTCASHGLVQDVSTNGFHRLIDLYHNVGQVEPEPQAMLFCGKRLFSEVLLQIQNTSLSLSLSFSPHSRQIPFEKTYIKSPSQKCAEYRPRIASLLNSLGPRRPNTGKAQDDPTTAIRNPRGSSNRRPGEAVRLEVHGIHGDPQPRRSDRKGRRWAKSGPWICLDEQQN